MLFIRFEKQCVYILKLSEDKENFFDNKKEKKIECKKK